jgi:adenine-specific DNA-methyltransferase
LNLRPRIAWAAGPRDPSTTKLYDRRGYNTQKATSKLEAAIADLKRRQRFGLVFEEHIPETMALLGLPIQVGGIVQRRDDPIGTSLYRVVAKAGRRMMTVELLSGGKPFSIPAEDLLVVKRFGDPIYPTLTSVGVLRRGVTEKPHYAVIDGENFHTLQLLVYLFEGQVDCIYIDPPYNTGTRDWKYNNGMWTKMIHGGTPSGSR